MRFSLNFPGFNPGIFRIYFFSGFKMFKFKLTDLIGLSPAFLFQDNTFSNSLRVCVDAVCQNLGDSNSTNMSITRVYEIGGDKLNANAFNLASNNIWAIGFLGVIFAIVLLMFYFLKKK